MAATERISLASLDEATEYFYKQGWTDGLPVVPPTEERVARLLEACRRKPDDVVMDIPARGRKVTAEKVAINAVMAGCLPEYMPVVMAAVEAMTDPAFNFHGTLNSTMGAAVMIIVNGPIRKTLDINSGGNLFGQGWRANATIGRAVRLVVMNACGGTPGTLDRATFGHGGKYSFCFAENEELSPWEPLHVERGFPLGASTVTVAASLAPLQTFDHLHHTAEGVVGHIGMALSSFGGPLHEAVIVISPEHLWHIKRAGWSKRQVKEHLFRTAKTTIASQK
ncbi:MAG: hypothetical protein HYX97_06360, partial [Chloroflexi bacterium]|nr:hypothetical protein [Chloroflexota bacterium]